VEGCYEGVQGLQRAVAPGKRKKKITVGYWGENECGID
jgi:hypothetical protein